MPQHFLLTSKAKTLSLMQIARLSDSEAHALLCEVRWGSREEQICPRCGVKHKAYVYAARKQYRCRHCKHQFSVTSGTIFANRKLPIQTYLFAIGLFVNATKGISACQLSRDLCVKYQTAFVLCHKIRESLKAQQAIFPLGSPDSEVHIDATYVHTAPRPANKKADRVDRRLKENANPNKRGLFVIRETYTKKERENAPHLVGAKRTLTFPILSENARVVNRLAKSYINPNTRVCADDNPAYDDLLIRYDLQRVNHQLEYRSDSGVTNNQAESFFARFKRMYYGQVHKMSNVYLDLYSNEVACREDTRRQDNLTIFRYVLGQCLATSHLNDWTGYNQGKHRTQERLMM